jgi:hypothetical protein
MLQGIIGFGRAILPYTPELKGAWFAPYSQYLPMANRAFATFTVRKNKMIDNCPRQTIKHSTKERRMRVSVDSQTMNSNGVSNSSQT